MNKNEIKLLKRLKKDDQNAFKEIFYIYYHRLVNYAKSYVFDKQIAEDIIQDIFFNIWIKRKELEINISLSAYLYRAVHNRCIQYLRQKYINENVFDPENSLKLKEAEILYQLYSNFSFSEIEFNEMEKIIKNTYNSLPQKTREVFDLSREHNLTYQEIAETLNMNIKTIEYHISRALKAFREALNDYFFK